MSGPRFSLQGKLTLLVGGMLAGALALGFVLQQVVQPAWLALLFTLTLTGPLAVWLLHRFMQPLNRTFRALADGVASLRDSDFSMNIADTRTDEIGELVRLYNGLGNILRDQRQNLLQRELLLDTVIQSTPLALVLCDAAGHIVYSNAAAREMYGRGRRLNGFTFADVLQDAPAALRTAIESRQDGLFSVDGDDEPETFHLSCREFLLNTRAHRLYLVKRLTREISRQEVATWKKVIRVISHELNNSLAPIASLAHSGNLIAQRSDPQRLRTVFSTIEERTAHLKQFIDGYARFAKLPQPRPEAVNWHDFVTTLRETSPFEIDGALPGLPGWFDPAQLEQVLINLLKNAVEAGSIERNIRLAVTQDASGATIRVSDRGSGMSDAVLASALLPFYSTKQTGTGLGLPLCREIIEAHKGRLQLRNRDGGGLSVELWLPVGPVTSGAGIAAAGTH